ncbi:MAG: DUF3575 domain-containing protein [Saprospiraceae bacterium]|nr:DUF3575 domain-containing protein [Saprospiraceae bacterium]
MYSTLKVSLSIFDRINLIKWGSTALTVFILLISIGKTEGQELRFGLSSQILGEINGGFTGYGFGIESRLSDHFSISGDCNIGYQSRGRALELKPAVLYYLNEQQKGIYLGPSMKYITIREKLDFNRFSDKLYAFGFSLGWKGTLSDHILLNLNLSPHKTFGGRNEADVAGISGQFSIGYRF